MALTGKDDPTADLLIREVDEDVRRDQYLELWRRYGLYAIIVCVLVVVAVGGWEGWQEWRARQQKDEAQRYGAAAQLAAQGKTKDAEDALGKLAATGRTGYAYAAGMRQADLLASGGDLKGAQAVYDGLAATQMDAQLRDLAVLKSAFLALDANGDAGGDLSALRVRVSAVASSGNPWYFQATELLGIIALKSGDSGKARDLFKQLADDSQAPQGIRTRAAELLAAAGDSVASAPAPVPTPVQAPASGAH